MYGWDRHSGRSRYVGVQCLNMLAMQEASIGNLFEVFLRVMMRAELRLLDVARQLSVLGEHSNPSLGAPYQEGGIWNFSLKGALSPLSDTVLIFTFRFLDEIEELPACFFPAFDSFFVFVTFASPLIFVVFLPFLPPLFVCMHPRLSTSTKRFSASQMDARYIFIISTRSTMGVSVLFQTGRPEARILDHPCQWPMYFPGCSSQSYPLCDGRASLLERKHPEDYQLPVICFFD